MALARTFSIEEREDEYLGAKRQWDNCTDPQTKTMLQGHVTFCYCKWQDAKKAEEEGV